MKPSRSKCKSRLHRGYFCSYRASVGEVELSWVFEDEVLTLFPFWILVLQINPEAFNVFDSCREATRGSASSNPNQSTPLSRFTSSVLTFFLS